MSPTSYEPVDRRVYRALAGDSRVQTLKVFREQRSPLGVADVAERVGLHPNTVRLHLDQLVEAGLATRAREKPSRPGRPRLVYSATPAASSERVPVGDRDGYRLLAEILTTQLEETSRGPAEAATEAGRAWGRDLARSATTPPGSDAADATEYMVGLLDDLGFDPRVTDPDDETGQDIELHRCPFLQVAENHSQVVCGVHLGLMQGALTKLGGPVQATQLEPFVAPGLCLTRLAPVEAGAYA